MTEINNRNLYRRLFCSKEKLNNKKVVVDIFTYFQESVMLSIRLFRMNNYVDCFIIVVSNTTFTGLPLHISFSPFEAFIRKYKKKLLLFTVSHPQKCKSAWCREEYQRNKISDIIFSLNLNQESIIIVSDLDEIPTSDAMKYIVNNPPSKLYMLKGFMYNYNYRHMFNKSWPGTIVVKARNCRNIQRYRNMRYKLSESNSIPIYPSQTHCSFCYKRIALIQKKFNSFSHTEYNKAPYNDRNHISYCIKNHLHFIFLYKFIVVEYNKTLLPLPHDARFNYLKYLYGLT